jgi:hypothetical protein
MPTFSARKLSTTGFQSVSSGLPVGIHSQSVAVSCWNKRVLARATRTGHWLGNRLAYTAYDSASSIGFAPAFCDFDTASDQMTAATITHVLIVVRRRSFIFAPMQVSSG